MQTYSHLAGKIIGRNHEKFLSIILVFNGTLWSILYLSFCGTFAQNIIKSVFDINQTFNYLLSIAIKFIISIVLLLLFRISTLLEFRFLAYISNALLLLFVITLICQMPYRMQAIPSDFKYNYIKLPTINELNLLSTAVFAFTSHLTLIYIQKTQIDVRKLPNRVSVYLKSHEKVTNNSFFIVFLFNYYRIFLIWTKSAG